MLISVTLENWKSFRDPTTFSMAADTEIDHGDQLFHVKDYNIKLLPIAAIFGGNASGKSNFITGIEYIADSVRNGDIATASPFALDDAFTDQETNFGLLILVKGKVFQYSFSVRGRVLIREKLIELQTNNSEHTWFEFTKDSKEPFSFSLDKFPLSSEEKKGYLAGLLKSRRENQLFLTLAYNTELNLYKDIYDTINSITVFTPSTKARLVDDTDKKLSELSYFMSGMDTGISAIKSIDVPKAKWGISNPIANDIIESLQNKVPIGFGIPLSQLPFFSGNNADVFLIKTAKGLIGRKYQNFHTKYTRLSSKRGSSEHKYANLREAGDRNFPLSMESDGTQRLLEIAPMFLNLLGNNDNQIVFIDEFDRSFHSLLTLHLLKLYMRSFSKKNRKQFIFTSHDIEVVASDLLHLDEKWVVQRKLPGNSEFTRLDQYENPPASSENIRKEYMQGRLGGIPNLLTSDFVSLPRGKE